MDIKDLIGQIENEINRRKKEHEEKNKIIINFKDSTLEEQTDDYVKIKVPANFIFTINFKKEKTA